ncbi:MAG: hypothetical protein U0R26_10455 [Solirubrobacterales bacterium]
MPSSSARAAVRPKIPAPTAPGTGAISIPSCSAAAGADEQLAQALVDPGSGADALALQHPEVAAPDPEVGAHDEEPVHALRLCREQLHALPPGDGGESGMGGAGDDVDLAPGEGFVGRVHREQ